MWPPGHSTHFPLGRRRRAPSPAQPSAPAPTASRDPAGPDGGGRREPPLTAPLPRGGDPPAFGDRAASPSAGRRSCDLGCGESSRNTAPRREKICQLTQRSLTIPRTSLERLLQTPDGRTSPETEEIHKMTEESSSCEEGSRQLLCLRERKSIRKNLHDTNRFICDKQQTAAEKTGSC
ncbi:uncharacterized protein [Struthio camelus]|uniref:uncharacterized protein n=1 Tax=Struthio camelus TaxID=8801 RepID=UPI003603FFFE